MAVISDWEENPTKGTTLGKDNYKICLAIASRNKGKSGGARIIANIVISETTVYVLSIYDKSEKEYLTDKELDEPLKAIPK